jgi:hypothetical protein
MGPQKDQRRDQQPIPLPSPTTTDSEEATSHPIRACGR